MDPSIAEEQKKVTQDHLNTLIQRREHERLLDKQIVQNLAHHDDVLQTKERERKQATQNELKQNLISQMGYKDALAASQTQRLNRSVERVEDDGFGSNDRNRVRNYNLKPEVEVSQHLKKTLEETNRETDKRIVAALSE